MDGMGMHGQGTESGGQHVRAELPDQSDRRTSDPNLIDQVQKHVDPRKPVRRRPVILNGVTVSVSHHVTEQVSVTPEVVAEPLESTQLPILWAVVVWDDPVNLMSYVTHVFMRHFRFTRSKAEQLMMLVHMEGRAVVETGSRESMEQHVYAMHGYGLLATLEQAD